MSENIKVSVILPVYNGERYLEKCMDDILGQSLPEIEVLCIDDGSTDQTFAILEKYERKDSRVSVSKQENAGAAAARNYGMTLASGEYLSFLDADDFFEPDMLALAYKHAKEQAADVVIFRGDRYDDTLEQSIQMEYSIKREQLPQKNPFAYRDIPDQIFTFAVGWAWDKLFRRAFIEDRKLQFQDLRTSNDLYFVFSSFVKAQRIYTMNELLVHHRIQVKASLSVTREKSWDCFFKAALALREELRQMDIYKEVEKGFLNWLLHFCFWNLDTIEGAAYETVYDFIRHQSAAEFGFLEHSREYYRQPELYDRISAMQKQSCQEYLLCEMKRLQEQNRDFEMQNRRNKDEMERLRQYVKELKESTIFRTGRVITAVPRKMKRLLKGENHA